MKFPDFASCPVVFKAGQSFACFLPVSYRQHVGEMDACSYKEIGHSRAQSRPNSLQYTLVSRGWLCSKHHNIWRVQPGNIILRTNILVVGDPG
jgi:hypothetical protein